jgi:D-lactate dehydrogenase (cytochrome)
VTFRLGARSPRSPAAEAVAITEPARIAAHLEDAAHVPGGHADALFVPASEGEIAAVLRAAASLLVVGGQSSLTGGATPRGGALLSTARLTGVELLDGYRVRAQAGVTLVALDAALARAGWWYPPTPTFLGATVGGIVSTNAAGAATFKYGATRAWVDALTVVLANGDVLDLARGQICASRDGRFEIVTSDGSMAIAVPRYVMPEVAKLSAGYFAAPGMDLIDLFIGAEGTLGVIVDATLRVLPQRPAACLVFMPFAERARALDAVAALREEARRTWRTGDPSGLDVSGIEHMDRRSLELLREDGLDRKTGVTLPDLAAMAVLVTVELPHGTTSEQAYDQIAQNDPATPLGRLCAILARHGDLEQAIVAAPGDHRRQQALLDVREGVPHAVNQRVGRARRDIDPRIEKTAGDMIVAFERVGELLELYEREFRARGLDAAIWGHISDGNVHPNVIPRSFADVESGRAAMLAFGREVLAIGGAPLSEHGVGRNTTKQMLLRSMYGDQGIADMRRVKRALDPDAKLAPGVLFAISAGEDG